MTFQIKLSDTEEVYKPFRAIIYGSGSDGKTTAAMSLLKNPRLRLILIAAEGTTLPALDMLGSVYDLPALQEGQLTIAIPRKEAFKTFEEMMALKDEAGYLAVHKHFFGGEAVDAATGKKVALKMLNTYDSNVVVIYDGFSAVNEQVQFKAFKDFEAQDTSGKAGKDKRNIYQVGQLLVQKFFAILNKASCNVILTAHVGSPADEEAKNKYEGLKDINPDFYTKSMVNKVTKDFGWVFLAKKQELGDKTIRFLSIKEKDYFTKGLMNEKEFLAYCAEANKGKVNQLEHIKFNQLPTDLTHACYPFLK